MGGEGKRERGGFNAQGGGAGGLNSGGRGGGVWEEGSTQVPRGVGGGECICSHTRTNRYSHGKEVPAVAITPPRPRSPPQDL